MIISGITVKMCRMVWYCSMGNHITDIKNYILFLKNKCDLSVTLHPFGADTVIVPSDLIQFNIHDNSYCIYVKTFPEAHRHCIERQYKIREKCSGGSFCGVCYAGVREYVYPIWNRDQLAGFVSVSGYSCPQSEPYLRKTAEKYSIPLENLKGVYASLRKDCPKKEEIDTMVMPLCHMLELAYIQYENDGREEETLIDRVIRYLKQYHTQDISLRDICIHFSCSRSQISHQFKQQTGRNIRTFLTEIRLEDAKSLLCYSKLTVTEIAYAVGFGDPDYFSNVFKKFVGMPPMTYRKSTSP